MSYFPPPPEGPQPAASPYAPPVAPSGTYSPDGRWFWDGQQWRPVSAPGPAWARPYAPPDARATAAMTLVGVVMAGSVVRIMAQGLELAAIGLTSPALDLVAGVLLIVALLVFFGGFVGGAISVPMWMHRCFRNLPALGATPRSWSPAWAAWAWFIPLGNLVIPYLVARELWALTPLGAEERRQSLVGLWWSAWIGADALQFVGNLLVNVNRAGSDAFGILSDLATIAAGVLLIVVIRLVSRGQRATYAQIHSAGA